jgi:tetratricopeptide (TPR) repeat protein
VTIEVNPRVLCSTAALATVLLSSLAAGPSWADEDEIRAHGRELFDRGVRANQQGRYSEAQALYERAFAYSPRRSALWNLAGCHLSQGNRDLAVFFLVRYMERDPEYLQSSEMQAAVAAIADSPPQIGDTARRSLLGQQVNRAHQAIEEGRWTRTAEGERRFGADVRSEEAARILTAAKTLDRELFSEGVRLTQDRRYPEALVFFERAFIFGSHRNVLWNLAACHLSQGRRDFALHFIDGYLERTPEARRSDQVQAVVSALADEPPNISNVSRRFEIWAEFSAAIDAALGTEDTAPTGGEP